MLAWFATLYESAVRVKEMLWVMFRDECSERFARRWSSHSNLVLYLSLMLEAGEIYWVSWQAQARPAFSRATFDTKTA